MSAQPLQSDTIERTAAERSKAPRPPETIDERAWRTFFERWNVEAPRFAVSKDYLHRDLVGTLRRLVPSDARVLEIGCGTGELLAALPNASKTGVDFTPVAIERAREAHPDITFLLDDAITFQRNERYDAIICDRLVHSVPDIQRLLENAAAHLEDNGRIFLSCYNFLWETLATVAERTGFKKPAPQGNWLSESDLDNLFALAGLERVKFEERLLFPAPIPGVATLLNRYVAPLPIINRLTLYRMYVLRKRLQPVKKKPSVSIVVPARNEAGNIANILARTPVMGSRTELIFVEGNSTDDTLETIQRHVASYRGPLQLSLHRQPGKGKADAVREGFKHATGDILMILDADITVPPEDLPKFYDAMTEGLADYVQGTRLVYPMEAQAMRFLNKLGNIGFSKIFTFILNQPIKDTLCGTKVLWSTDYDRLVANRAYFGDFDPFGDFDLILGASKLNLKLIEIPIRYRDRTYGTTNISRFRHGWMLLQMSVFAARKLKFV
jgi:SAM-dependent methyltransferase